MKLFVFILSIYVFVLAVRPCAHAHIENVDHPVEHSDHEHGADEEAFCSPFCICSCANAIETTNIGVRIEMVVVPVNQELNNVVVENLHSDFLPSFWQPPKI